MRWGGSQLQQQDLAGTERPSKLVLSGYGAGLDIKKSDYLAIDDRLAGSAQKTSPSEVDGGVETPKMEPVKKSDIAGE